MIGDFVRLMFVLAAVLLLAYAAARYLVPRMTGIKPVSSGPLQVLARLPLEPGKSLYIIKAGECHFLLGTSADGMQYLASLNAEELQLQPGATDARHVEFGHLLKSLRGRRD